MDKDKKIVRDPGREYLDNTKMEIPVNLKSKSIYGDGDRLKTMMKHLIHDLRDSQVVESFEESLDFEVDDGDDDLSSVVSQGEMRYMQEEKLLTEANEAGKVVLQRRAASKLRSKRNGQSQGGDGNERVRNGDARSRDAGYERGAEREQEGRSGEAASGRAGSRERG